MNRRGNGGKLRGRVYPKCVCGHVYFRHTFDLQTIERGTRGACQVRNCNCQQLQQQEGTTRMKSVVNVDHSIATINKVRKHYEAGHGGRHWFQPSTMKFFDSQLHASVTTNDGTITLFITSEKGPHQNVALFTVRRYDWGTREIDDYSKFQQFTNLRSALIVAEDGVRAYNNIARQPVTR